MLGLRTDHKKDLASAYKSMMLSAAWHDLEKYANQERESSMRRMDSTAASDLSLGEVCEERGIRKGIYKILKYAEQCSEGV